MISNSTPLITLSYIPIELLKTLRFKTRLLLFVHIHFIKRTFSNKIQMTLLSYIHFIKDINLKIMLALYSSVFSVLQIIPYNFTGLDLLAVIPLYFTWPELLSLVMYMNIHLCRGLHIISICITLLPLNDLY